MRQQVGVGQAQGRMALSLEFLKRQDIEGTGGTMKQPSDVLLPGFFEHLGVGAFDADSKPP